MKMHRGVFWDLYIITQKDSRKPSKMNSFEWGKSQSPEDNLRGNSRA